MSTASTTLTKSPSQTGDKGSVFFPALENDIQQLNDHTHNGLNSAKIPSSSVTTSTQNVAAAGWASVSDGRYRQSVTLAGGLLYDEKVITFKDQTTKAVLILGIEKVSATAFYVYSNNNTLDLTVCYS